MSSSSSARDVMNPVHDVFLSHSGMQKGFAKDLYRVLSPLYNTFFDIKHHSLPPGDTFPSHIFRAAKRCRLALVVLSEEYVSSKWPMLELSFFTNAQVRILPLFFQLSPMDLKDPYNLERWRNKWTAYADPRINSSEWEQALRILCSYNGVLYNTSEGILAYLDEIVSCMSHVMPPAIRCDDHLIQGKDRLCKVIVDKFEDMVLGSHNSWDKKAFVLGLYGSRGCGKSTLSLMLRDYFFPDFKGKVLYMKLPAGDGRSHEEALIKVFKMLLDLTNFQKRFSLDQVSDLREVTRLLKVYQLPSLSVFLVVDNICNESMQAVKTILEVGVGPGSKVILVARSLDVLGPALGMEGHRYICGSIGMPRLDATELRTLFRQRIEAGLDLECGMATQKKLTSIQQRRIFVTALKLSSEGNKLYLPLDVVEAAEDHLRLLRREEEEERFLQSEQLRLLCSEGELLSSEDDQFRQLLKIEEIP